MKKKIFYSLRKPSLALLFLCTCLYLLTGCSKKTLSSEAVTITAANLTVSLAENPQAGQSIGTVEGSASSGTVAFAIVSQTPNGAININSNTGAVSVADVSAFDFETNPIITAQIRVFSGNAEQQVTVTINLQDIVENTNMPPRTIWQGEAINFSKADGADPSMVANQDRITGNVWFTRGNNGGQIYNAKVESSSDKATSPTGTTWAIGSIDNIDNLNFQPFRNTVEPKEVVGRDLVLHLVEDNIYLSLTFTGWSGNKQGGFAYRRSTP